MCGQISRGRFRDTESRPLINIRDLDVSACNSALQLLQNELKRQGKARCSYIAHFTELSVSIMSHSQATLLM